MLGAICVKLRHLDPALLSPIVLGASLFYHTTNCKKKKGLTSGCVLLLEPKQMKHEWQNPGLPNHEDYLGHAWHNMPFEALRFPQFDIERRARNKSKINQ